MAFPAIHIIASVLAWMSATINPFIYAFKNRQYQQAFKKVRLTSTNILIFSNSVTLALVRFLSKILLPQLLCVDKSMARGGQRTTTSQASAQSR